MAEHSPHRRDDVEVSQSGDAITLKAPPGGVTMNVDESLDLAGRLVEACMRASGADPAESDTVRIPMQHIHVAAERLAEDGDGEGEVAAGPAEEDLSDARFAEVHCWIRDQTQRNAMHIAAGWIAEHGWVITEVLDQKPVTRDDFADTDYLPYYEQALTDSEVFLYEVEDESEQTEGPTDAS